MILAGDVGGTKTQLCLFEIEGVLRPTRKSIFPSQSYEALELIVSEFVEGIDESVDAACFGVAGPIVDGNCITTNLPWNVKSSSLARALSLPRVVLLNDLEAFGYGIPLVASEEMSVLNAGENVDGNAGIVAAGTGLGVAGMFWDGKQHIPSASEGGHVDFAPRGKVEIELLRFLLKQFDHVSVERIVSGPGLFLIYDFLRSSGYGKETQEMQTRLTVQDPSTVISAAALAGEDDLSIQALDIFTAIYGATAGNLALTLMAKGGIYVAGGIAPKILKKLKDGTFMRAFLDKGRFSSLLAKMPVRVILNDELPLLGAARVAMAQLDGSN